MGVLEHLFAQGGGALSSAPRYPRIPDSVIAEMANRLLERFDVHRQPVNVFDLASRLGVAIERRPFTNLLGGLLFDEGGPCIFYNSNVPTTRARFTVAHELGHFVLHRRQGIYFMCQENSKRLAERQANRFAAEILMPAAAVRAQDLAGWSVEYMARSFVVSTEAMERRAAELGLTG